MKITKQKVSIKYKVRIVTDLGTNISGQINICGHIFLMLWNSMSPTTAEQNQTAPSFV